MLAAAVAGCGSSSSDRPQAGESAQKACERLVDHSGKYEHGSYAWRDRVERCVESLPPAN